MADTYKLLAGLVIFVLFVGSGLAMAASTFPDLAPGGQSPAQALPSSSHPTFGTPANCTSGDWGCAVSSFLTSAGNNLAMAVATGGAIIGMFIALLTFQIPAFQENPLLQFLNFLIIIPMFAVLFFFLFRVLKGLVPTVGGDAD